MARRNGQRYSGLKATFENDQIEFRRVVTSGLPQELADIIVSYAPPEKFKLPDPMGPGEYVNRWFDFVWEQANEDLREGNYSPRCRKRVVEWVELQSRYSEEFGLGPFDGSVGRLFDHMDDNDLGRLCLEPHEVERYGLAYRYPLVVDADDHELHSHSEEEEHDAGETSSEESSMADSSSPSS